MRDGDRDENNRKRYQDGKNTQTRNEDTYTETRYRSEDNTDGHTQEDQGNGTAFLYAQTRG